MVQAANNASTRLRFTIIVISPWGKWVERQGRESAECKAVGFVAVAEHETPALPALHALRGVAVALFPSAIGNSGLRTAAL